MKALSAPNQPIGSLTIAELETLITETVRRVLREEIHPTNRHNGDKIPEEFLATFGTWEDDRPAGEIVTEIYASRTVSKADISL
jgi:hypothetical protein